MWIDSLLTILTRLLPSRKEGYVEELNRLLVEYQEYLHTGQDTKAAIVRKKMKVLREKLGYADDI